MARKAQITIYTALKDQGFKKAEKGLKNLRFQANGLNSSLAKLGLGIGVAQFARTSVAAAVEMEQANSRLAVSLKNIGKASAIGSDSIRASEKSMMSLGFEGTQTALALSSLVTATGSLEKSQGMLAASADLARFKNIDLASASVILAKASGGNAKAFKELGITLDKSLPPAKALEKAMGMLNAKIGGQAAAYATTYAGKLEILKAQFQDVQEQVGIKLLPELVKLGDFLINTGIPRLETFFTFIGKNISTVTSMATALTTVALAFKSIATYASLAKVAALPIMGAAAPFVAAIGALVGLITLTETSSAASKAKAKAVRDAGGGLSKFGAVGSYRTAQAQASMANYGKSKAFSNPMGQTFGQPVQVNRQAAQAAKDAAAAAKKTADLAKKDAAAKLAAQRIINADKRLAAQFDLNQIALANALKLNLTDKEKAAVQGLIALQDDGYKTETQRMLDQEAALRKLISLRTDLASIPFYSPTLAGQEKQMPTGTAGVVKDLLNGNMDATSAGQLAKQLKLDAMTPAPAKNGGHAIAPSFNLDPSSTMTAQEAALYNASRPAAAPQVTINVAGSILKEQELIAMIQNGTQLSSLSGSPSQIGRISGMFG